MTKTRLKNKNIEIHRVIKIILVFPVLLLLIQCESQNKSLDEILLKKYEQHFISSGDNFPEISLFDNDRYKFFHENT